MDSENLKHRLIKRIEVEASAAAVLILVILAFRDSTDILLGLSLIYIICLAVIYGFRNGT